MKNLIHLDCTLRDGGSYNSWDFAPNLINKYLQAMAAAKVDYVEIGLRSVATNPQLGICAQATDEMIEGLEVPADLKLCVMVFAVELLGETPLLAALEKMFPRKVADSPIDLVRIACHLHEFVPALPAVAWLKERGYKVGFNLMQIADRSEQEIKSIAQQASKHQIDALYFADSMGSLTPAITTKIVGWLRSEWKGDLGIHTHDNLGLALTNSLQAMKDGVTWIDSTVTGMGRGPGNARTEELVIELAQMRGNNPDLVPLFDLVEQDFKPMQQKFGWGTNPFYYLSGKYGIHPTFVQEMLAEEFATAKILAALEFLHQAGGKKFSKNLLEESLAF